MKLIKPKPVQHSYSPDPDMQIAERRTDELERTVREVERYARALGLSK